MKEYYSLKGFGKKAFSLKLFFFSPEMLKNILVVMRHFAQILAGKNFLLNN